MIRSVAYVLVAALWVVSLATSARADAVTTYTWETLSQSNPTLNLMLSFAVTSNVSINANSDFVDSVQPVPYPFPPELLSFDILVGDLVVNLGSFVSSSVEFEGNPIWTITLNADPVDLTANLFINFQNAPSGTDEILGDAPGTLAYGSDNAALGCFFDLNCKFTGVLVAATVAPEPPSFWVLIAAIGMLGLVRHRFRSPA